MKFIIIIIIFSIGFATDIESAEPLSEVCTVRDMRPFVNVLIVVLALCCAWEGMLQGIPHTL